MSAKWHFDPQDTPEHRRTLRSVRAAQVVRSRFPAGTRVRPRGKDGQAYLSGPVGVVRRHVPGHNAQGGYLVVEWSNGVTGRMGPIMLVSLDSEC